MSVCWEFWRKNFDLGIDFAAVGTIFKMSCNQRVGILVMGYFKLIFLDLLNLVFSVSFSYQMFKLYIKYDESWQMLVYPVTSTAFLLIQICFCILLLAGGHKKKQSLLRVYFWYAITGVIGTILLTVYSLVGNIQTFIRHPRYRDIILRNPEVYLSIFWFGLLNIAIQICLLVFVRREMRKLQNTTNETKTTEVHTKETELHNI